jgi:hypothetical protein
MERGILKETATFVAWRPASRTELLSLVEAEKLDFRAPTLPRDMQARAVVTGSTV